MQFHVWVLPPALLLPPLCPLKLMLKPPLKLVLTGLQVSCMMAEESGSHLRPSRAPWESQAWTSLTEKERGPRPPEKVDTPRLLCVRSRLTSVDTLVLGS